MSPEAKKGCQRDESIQEPPKIRGYFDVFRNHGQDRLTPAQLKTILHLLPQEQRASLEKTLSESDAKFWGEHMAFRRGGYEAYARMTDFRQNTAKLISPEPEAEVFDLGAGLGSMAPYIAEVAPNLHYYAVEYAPQAQAPAEALLSKLVSEGRLTKANFIMHNLLEGFPQVVAHDGKPRVAFSVFSASYFPADRLQDLVRSSFKAGCHKFVLVTLKEDFDGRQITQEQDAIFQEMEKNASEELKTQIRAAREAYPHMIAFGDQIASQFPVRSIEETIHYLGKVGKVVETRELGTGSRGFVVKAA